MTMRKIVDGKKRGNQGGSVPSFDIETASLCSENGRSYSLRRAKDFERMHTHITCHQLDEKRLIDLCYQELRPLVSQTAKDPEWLSFVLLYLNMGRLD